MGIIRTEITLTNSDDIAFAHAGFIEKDKVRHLETKALVDTGAEMLCLPHSVSTQLGLKKLGDTTAQLANGDVIAVDLVGPVDIQVLNRKNVVMAMVLPTANEVLLGSIAMQGMDLLIDPRNETVTLPPERPYLGQVLLM